MGKIKTLVLLVAGFFISGMCFGKQISFQIVQHDARISTVTEQSFLFEDELLNFFFECGYIVTNSPAAVSVSENQDATLWTTGYEDALDGCSDYFIQIKLFYEKSPDGNPSHVVLQKIDWSVSLVSTGKIIKNNTLKYNKAYATDDDLRKLSSELVADIRKSIKA